MPLVKPSTRWRACWAWVTPVARRSRLQPAAVILIALLSLPGGSPCGGGFHPYDFSFSGLKTAVLREVERWRQQGKSCRWLIWPPRFKPWSAGFCGAQRALRRRPRAQRCGGGGGVSANGACASGCNGHAAARSGVALGPLGLVHRQRRHDRAGACRRFAAQQQSSLQLGWRPVGLWVRPMPCMGRHRFERKFVLR